MTTPIDINRVKVIYKLDGLTKVMENEVKELTEKNLEIKMLSSFKKIFTNHPDTDIIIDINIEKNEQTRYEGTFNITYAGNTETYHNDKPFKILKDLVNHAFQNIKGKILDK